MTIPTSKRKRRLTGVMAMAAAVGIAPAAAAMGATGFADPSATTTTTTTTTAPRPSDIVAVTTTTTTTTTTSTTPTPPSRPPRTTPAPVIEAPDVTTTEPVDDVALVPIPPGEPGQLVASATVPVGADDPAPIGEWSTDPDDWSPEVRAYLTSQGVDIDDLAGQGQAAGDVDIGGFEVEQSCAINCITAGLAHAVGVGVYLEVTTSVPAFIQIEIVDVGLKFAPEYLMEWGNTWAHLEPGTTYEVIARAHDVYGNMAVASGSFTTMTRSAEITFTPTVFWFGNDPTFDPFGDYTWQLEASAYLDEAEQASAIGEIASSENILATAAALGLTIETGQVDESVIEVAYVGLYRCVSGCDDDSDLVQAVSSMVDKANGQAEEFWWGTVANGIQLDGYPDDVTSWTGHQFTFPLSTFHGEPVGPAVYLTTDVTVVVSYIPPD